MAPEGPLSSGTGPAPDKVRFPSHDADLTGGSPTIIDGYLFKPVGQGPFPALVALHGCSGLFAKSGRFQRRDLDWARRLQGLGYVVLFPDSLTPRGITEVCTRGDIGGRMPFRERPRDVYGALTWLQSQPSVQRDHVGLMGWSNGGSTVLSTIDASSQARPADLADDFRVAIAFYPGCRTVEKKVDWTTRIPLTILIGEADDWTSASPCAALANRARQAGAPVEIVIYPGAHHDFDAPNQPLTVRSGLAHTVRQDGQTTVGTNAAARADAIERVRALLARHLQDGSLPTTPSAVQF
ncbi:MAG TPA: dienelactone hydrolase family protein [Syntrophobacteria bacterium]|nr:dienelactone hydrolase family protein [Syntrophobacteria bacterium]